MIDAAKLGDKLRWRWKRTLSLAPTIINHFFATSYYDVVLARRIKTYAGHIAWSPRAVVFLIFPRSGILRSHLATLEYLVGKGCAPVVVSNLPLSENDRLAVLKRCHRLLVRPNFGYDFGGYRDGILSLKSDINRLASLTLLNDSCWFPLPGASDWLDDAEALGVDFAGAASNYGMTPQSPGDYTFSAWNYRPDNAGFHYCSFALHISSRLLRDRGFQRFWTHFKLTNDKVKVVLRGEVGLSQWVIRNGFSHASTLDIARLDIDLAAIPLDRIKQIAQALIIPEEAELRRVKRELLNRFDASETWREEAVRFILLAVAQTGASYALPEYAIRDKRFPFLKKSPLSLDREAAETTIDIARRLDGADGAAILAEANNLKK